ncbi:DUF4386 domain-containing protein [Nocardioides sp. YIM 152588]|uniref:DUF4386 domain-containing protein n=1 Tax=Nocardioides sp. YIM 152588 TaxID=3158259 RepID=UPI0032E3D71C
MTATATTSPAPSHEAGPTGPAPSRRLRRLSRAAGVLYLAIFVIYPLAVAVRSTLVVPGDAATTAANIAADETLFRWGLAGESAVVLIEVLLAGVLYALLRPVSRAGSLAAALARVAEAVVMAAGPIAAGVVTLVLVGGGGYLAAFEPDQRDALVMVFQEANDGMVLVWGFFFGLSLVLTGWLVHRSGFLPRLPGVLLALAGAAYLLQSFGTFVAPGAADLWDAVVLVAAIPGELVFALWLLVRGVDADRWAAAADRARDARV